MCARAYAFSGRRPVVLVVLALPYLGLVGLNIWVFCTGISIPPMAYYVITGGTGCFPDYGAETVKLRIGVSTICLL